MAASVESIGGTTLHTMMPSTFSISSPAGENRLRSRMPHSSDVCSCTVRRRHCEISWRPSHAPMVMLLLSASRARSLEAGVDAVNIAPRLVHNHAPAGGVTGIVGEEVENLFDAQRGEAFHG